MPALGTVERSSAPFEGCSTSTAGAQQDAVVQASFTGRIEALAQAAIEQRLVYIRGSCSKLSAQNAISRKYQKLLERTLVFNGLCIDQAYRAQKDSAELISCLRLHPEEWTLAAKSKLQEVMDRDLVCRYPASICTPAFVCLVAAAFCRMSHSPDDLNQELMGRLLQFLTLKIRSQEAGQLNSDLDSAVVEALQAQATVTSKAADVAYHQLVQICVQIGIMVASLGAAEAIPVAAPALIGLSWLGRGLAGLFMRTTPTTTTLSPLLEHSVKLFKDLQRNVHTTVAAVEEMAAAVNATHSDMARMCRHNGVAETQSSDCVSSRGVDAACLSSISQHKAKVTKLNEDLTRVIDALPDADAYCERQLDLFRSLLAQPNPYI